MTNPVKGRIKRTRVPCPDCGAKMVDGGACGYYCTEPGCDHDTIKGAKAAMSVKPPSLHDILATAGDLNTLKPHKIERVRGPATTARLRKRKVKRKGKA